MEVDEKLPAPRWGQTAVKEKQATSEAPSFLIRVLRA
jgi:hypothetical protein